MHINITKSETGNNKGSSSQLVAYLEKETGWLKNWINTISRSIGSAMNGKISYLMKLGRA